MIKVKCKCYDKKNHFLLLNIITIIFIQENISKVYFLIKLTFWIFYLETFSFFELMFRKNIFKNQKNAQLIKRSRFSGIINCFLLC